MDIRLLDNKEVAKMIRNDLKREGITNKFVKVKKEGNQSIDVNILTIDIDKNKVENICKKYEIIDRDINGEILQGCNIITNVHYDYDAIEQLKRMFDKKAKELYEADKSCYKGDCIEVYRDKECELLYSNIEGEIYLFYKYGGINEELQSYNKHKTFRSKWTAKSYGMVSKVMSDLYLEFNLCEDLKNILLSK